MKRLLPQLGAALFFAAALNLAVIPAVEAAAVTPNNVRNSSGGAATVVPVLTVDESGNYVAAGGGGGGDATAANQTTGNASLGVIDDWDESDRAKVNPIVGQAGVAAGNGAVGATTQRVAIADIGTGEYETIAASQTAQAMGATGGAGDYLLQVVCAPATTSPGVVTVLDNATSLIAFPGGASSVSNLIPFTLTVNAYSTSGAWKITTGANISCVAVGNFT